MFDEFLKCDLCERKLVLNPASDKWICPNMDCTNSGWIKIGRRKIIQIETCPINTIGFDDGTTNTTNAVFALCDDGTLWMQIIGGQGNWTPIDGVPQGDFEEINNQDEAAGG